MKAYEVDCGVTYWVVAKDICDAMRALATCWEQEGTENETEYVTLEELSATRVGEITVRDDGIDRTEPLAAIVARTTEATVVACSEWP